MKVLIVSEDKLIMKMVGSFNHDSGIEFKIFNEKVDPLSLLSSMIEEHASSIVLDDDFLKPNTVQILKSIIKFHKNIPIVFITSDSSLELGKEVSQLGIHFYAIKPLSENEFNELINSLIKTKEKITY
ncbi:MAG TPA: response regulator [Paenisporosarcina sp.]|nr:response regulator [Paenisporosarcina sp.]